MDVTELTEFFTTKSSESLIYKPKKFSFQSFAIPETIIYYISKNVSQFVNQKLIYSCKYFLINQKFVVFHDLSSFSLDSSKNPTYVDETFSKLWLTGDFLISCYPKECSYIFTKLFFVDLRRLNFDKDFEISWNDFRFLTFTGKITYLFSNCEIKYSDGSVVLLADILEKLPLIETFSFIIDKEVLFCTVETAEKMAKLPILTNLEYFDIGFVLPIVFCESKGYQIFKQKHSFVKRSVFNNPYLKS